MDYDAINYHGCDLTETTNASSGHLQLYRLMTFAIISSCKDIGQINKSVNYNLAVFFKNMDSDAISYCRRKLIAINLKFCMQIVDTYSYRLMTFEIIFQL